jgi:hypothetical protein
LADLNLSIVRFDSCAATILREMAVTRATALLERLHEATPGKPPRPPVSPQRSMGAATAATIGFAPASVAHPLLAAIDGDDAGLAALDLGATAPSRSAMRFVGVSPMSSDASGTRDAGLGATSRFGGGAGGTPVAAAAAAVAAGGTAASLRAARESVGASRHTLEATARAMSGTSFSYAAARDAPSPSGGDHSAFGAPTHYDERGNDDDGGGGDGGDGDGRGMVMWRQRVAAAHEAELVALRAAHAAELEAQGRQLAEASGALAVSRRAAQELQVSRAADRAEVRRWQASETSLSRDQLAALSALKEELLHARDAAQRAVASEAAWRSQLAAASDERRLERAEESGTRDGLHAALAELEGARTRQAELAAAAAESARALEVERVSVAMLRRAHEASERERQRLRHECKRMERLVYGNGSPSRGWAPPPAMARRAPSAPAATTATARLSPAIAAPRPLRGGSGARPSEAVADGTRRALWGESRRNHRPLQSDVLRRFQRDAAPSHAGTAAAAVAVAAAAVATTTKKKALRKKKKVAKTRTKTKAAAS